MRTHDLTHHLLVRRGIARIGHWVDDQVLGDAEDRDALLVETRIRYWHLVGEVPWPERHAMQLHLTLSILPAAALYRALRDRHLSEDQAVSTVAALVARQTGPHRRRLERITRHRAARGAFLPVARGVTRVGFPSPGWEITWRERSRHAVAFDISTCYFLETFRALGMPELTRAFCAGDDVMYAGLCPQLRWQRSGTLGRGAPRCDFRFEHSEEPVG